MLYLAGISMIWDITACILNCPMLHTFVCVHPHTHYLSSQWSNYLVCVHQCESVLSSRAPLNQIKRHTHLTQHTACQERHNTQLNNSSHLTSTSCLILLHNELRGGSSTDPVMQWSLELIIFNFLTAGWIKPLQL